MRKFISLKKTVFCLLLSTMILLQIIPSFSAETYSQNDESEYELWVDDTISSKVSVINADGEILIPARPLIEALSMNIEWDGKNQEIVITYNKSVLVMQHGSNEYILNSTPKTMSGAPAIYEGRTYLPLKVIVQAFGLSATFKANEKTIKVYTNLNISTTPNPQTYSQNDVSEYELWVDNTMSSKVPVINADGEFLIPARPLVEALSMDIEWDGENHRIVLTYNKSVMFMKQGSNEYILDNTPNTMPVAPAIFEGRTYLPLKAIVQAFGLSVSSDSGKKTIEVYTNLNISPTPQTYTPTPSNTPTSVINITSPSSGEEKYFSVRMGPNYPVTPSHGIIPITVDINKGEKTIESVSFYCGDTYLGESKDNEFDWNVDLKSYIYSPQEVFIKAKVKFTDGTEYESEEVNITIFVSHVDVYTTPTPTPKSSILGDVNCDLEINSIDLALQIKYLLGIIDEKGLCISNADINSDGQINAIDAALIRRVILGFK